LDGRAPLTRWLPLLGVGVLLAVAAGAAALSSPQVTRVPLPPRPSATPRPAGSGTATATDQATGPPSREPVVVVELPAWLPTVAQAVCLLLAAALVAALAWYAVRDSIHLRRRPPAVDDAEPDRLARPAGEVVAALDAGLEALGDADTDPRRAVIACWLRLEAAAAAAGTPRRVADSPTDLVLRLLGGHRVSRRALDDLAAVYRAARYGTGPVGEADRRTAVAALAQLRAELSAPDPAGAAP
jgi:hypothetical protein